VSFPQNTHPKEETLLKEFLQKYKAVVIGILSGFDRIVFHGKLRNMAFTDGLMLYLSVNKIMFKDAKTHFLDVSQRIKAASLQVAEEQGRRVKYLESSKMSKEEEAREIARKDGISAGLICVLTCVEPCQTVIIQRDRKTKHQNIRYGLRKCLHYYFCFMHPEYGQMHVRLQTWFPFTVQVCLNGREWLARALDKEGIAYRKSDNCFRNIENVRRAQKLAQAQVIKPQYSHSWLNLAQWLCHAGQPALSGDLWKVSNPILLDRASDGMGNRRDV
jgi:hypothetical protein